MRKTHNEFFPENTFIVRILKLFDEPSRRARIDDTHCSRDKVHEEYAQLTHTQQIHKDIITRNIRKQFNRIMFHYALEISPIYAPSNSSSIFHAIHVEFVFHSNLTLIKYFHISS